MLDLDITVLYTIVILWILLVVLNRIFFKPVGKMINEREKKSAEESSSIERMGENIEERSGKIESVLKKARKDSVLISEEIIRKGELAREEMLKEARLKASEKFRQSMEEMEKDIREAEETLTGEIKVFSRKIEEIFS